MLRPIAVALATLVSTAAFAQTTIHGSLSGVVRDPRGAVVAGAELVVVHASTGGRLATRSGEDGTYVFSRLSPGTYALTAHAAGFGMTTVRDIVVAVNESAVRHVTLAIEGIEEAVTVTAGTEMLQMRSAEVALSVNERRIRELPLNGQNFQRLMLLAPGVGGGSLTSPAISGARPFTTTYTLDGATASDERAQTGLATGGGAAAFGAAAPNLISTEAIQEFTVVTSNADASFGRGSGGQVNIITRSGTNELRGSGSYYGRHDAFDARDFFNHGPFFDDDGRAVVPPFRQHLYGISAGGPLRRDRHFLFGSFEGFRQALEQTSSATVPNAALIDQIPGDLRRLYEAFYIGRGIVPATGNPAGSLAPLPPAARAAAIAGGFEPALFDGALENGEAGTVLISTSNTRDVSQDAVFLRTDHRLDRGWSLSARYAHAQPTLTSNTRAIAGVVTDQKRRWQSATAEAVGILTPTQVLEARFSLMRSRMHDRPRHGIDAELLALGIDPTLGLTSVVNGTALSRLTVPGAAGFLDNQDVPQVAALHNLVRGRWTIRSGADLRWLRLNNLLVSNAPFFQFNGFVGPNGLIGATPLQPQAVMVEASGTVYGMPQGPDTPERTWHSTVQEYFAQADWRMRNDLTVNLGLRYSRFGVFTEAGGTLANLYAVNPHGEIVPDVSPFTYGPLANVSAPVTKDRPFIQPDRTNWQPRVGMAWNVGRLSRTVVRGAAGLYFDRPFQGLWEFGVLNYPFASSAVFRDLPFRNAGDLPVEGQPTQARFVDPALKNPRTLRFSAAVEQQVTDAASVSVAYVGARADRLWRFLEPNGQGAVPQAARPDPRFSRYRYTASVSESQYDALQLLARHRYRRGLDLTVAYTYSRSRDDWSSDLQSPSLINLGASPAPGFQGGRPGDWVSRPIDVDWGPSDFDVPHSLVMSHVWRLPNFGRRRLLGGFTLAGMLVARSGHPFTIVAGQDFEDVGFSGSARPALAGGASLADLYADGGDKRQYLVPKSAADRLLGIPLDVTNPYLQIGRNAMQAPAVWFYDVSLSKRVPLGGTAAAVIALNAFNVFNRASLGAPIGTLSDARFGLSTASAPGTTPRQLQFGVRMQF